MALYDVWAPLPERVRLVLDDERHELTRDHDGWWRAPEGLDRGPGHRYGFVLDDDATPLPDPRSLRQPDGVHALSETYDPAEFAWTDDAWRGRPWPAP
ncbi:hypothetical protein GCM10025867_21760 [Frondihabitans sucicola]|uniref:Malto-oligosyltrehalose trehalohydrolase n=1 Tax=Frondihabitans sucicola TaxID=1268041 RepID=A0ABN6Y238_9MICO|nr:hypothetical protein GCM10025867_21760 [Frondihabitans sucicola]